MKRERLTQKERRVQTREHLLEAARALFVEEGFLGTSLAALADAAGYTRGAFYSNFNDKADLLIEILRRPEARPTCALRAAILELYAHMQSDDCLALWVEASLLAKREPAFRERLESLLTDMKPTDPGQGLESAT